MEGVASAAEVADCASSCNVHSLYRIRSRHAESFGIAAETRGVECFDADALHCKSRSVRKQVTGLKKRQGPCPRFFTGAKHHWRCPSRHFNAVTTRTGSACWDPDSNRLATGMRYGSRGPPPLFGGACQAKKEKLTVRA